MKWVFTALFCSTFCLLFGQTRAVLSSGNFSQDWSDKNLINTHDVWSGVFAIRGFYLASSSSQTGVDPRAVVASTFGASVGTLVPDVVANANPNTSSGGVLEVDQISNPTIALQGSATADASFIVLYLDATAVQNIRLQFKVRDLDASTDDAVQQLAVQYRLGPTSDYENLIGGYYADVTLPSSATLQTNVDLILPAPVNNQPELEIRILTTNAPGSDELIGIDDIMVTSDPIQSLTPPSAVMPVIPTIIRNVSVVSFKVVYSDESGVALQTIGSGDISVIGPDGSTYLPSAVQTDADENTLTVTYAIQQASAFLEGLYEVFLNDEEVFDSQDNAAISLKLGDIRIRIANPIGSLQGAAHRSPFEGKQIAAEGIVTYVKDNGFIFQSIIPDNNAATSEALFVFTASTPVVSLGDHVIVEGRIVEYRQQVAGPGLSETQITNPELRYFVLQSSQQLPDYIRLGATGRVVPSRVIDNDSKGDVELGLVFDPAEDGIDFFESLEHMRVEIPSVVVTGGVNSFGEVFCVPLSDEVNQRGSVVIQADDFNPERLKLAPPVGQSNLSFGHGSILSSVKGIVGYSFSNFQIQLTETPSSSNSLAKSKEVATSGEEIDHLRVASLNMHNLNTQKGTEHFLLWAKTIVHSLKLPEILCLQEIQDDNGTAGGESNPLVSAQSTLQSLVNAIEFESGREYQFVQIDPQPNTNGGVPGGNIRVAFLFDPAKVDFSKWITPGADSAVVAYNDGEVLLKTNPSLINPQSAAFKNSRKPLVAQFRFNDNSIFLIGTHLNSRTSDDPLYGRNQPPQLLSEVQRTAQAKAILDFVSGINQLDKDAKIILAGDFNDFQFSPVLQMFVSKGMEIGFNQIPVKDRYSYIYEGNAQALDHIVYSKGLIGAAVEFDVVHCHTEFENSLSDHDPIVMDLYLPHKPQIPNGLQVEWVSANKARVKWNQSARASTYDVFFSDDGFVSSKMMTVDDTIITGFGLSPNRLYKVRVRSTNPSGSSAFSQAINFVTTTLPPAPEVMTISLTPWSLNVQWQSVVGSSVMVDVRKLQTTGYEFIFRDSVILGDQFTVKEVIPETKFQIRARTINLRDTSEFSEWTNIQLPKVIRKLVVSPSIDFGDVLPDENNSISLLISNEGNDTIEFIKVIAPSWLQAQWPMYLLAGESKEVEISFAATGVGKFSDEIKIYSNADEPEVVVTVDANVLLVTSVEKWAIARNIEISPNPTAGRFRVYKHGEFYLGHIHVVDTLGRKFICIPDCDGFFDMTSFAAGVFILYTEENSFAGRIIKY